MSDVVDFWRIAADTPDYVAEGLSGEGARQTGGRWNRKGTPVVYAASSRALACLETIVHLGAGTLPLNRYLVRLQVPRNLWQNAACIDPDQLIGWDALPAGKVSLDWGDAWLASQQSALARVPSIVVPEEYCVLVNPRHPDAKTITAVKVRRWLYDGRLCTSLGH